MIKLIDSRTFEQFHTDKLNHASQVALKHANGYFYSIGSVKYDNAGCAGDYAKCAANHAFELNPHLRIETAQTSLLDAVYGVKAKV